MSAVGAVTDVNQATTERAMGKMVTLALATTPSRLRSVIIGPTVRSIPEDPLVTVVPSLLRQVLS